VCTNILSTVHEIAKSCIAVHNTQFHKVSVVTCLRMDGILHYQFSPFAPKSVSEIFFWRGRESDSISQSHGQKLGIMLKDYFLNVQNSFCFKGSFN